MLHHFFSTGGDGGDGDRAPPNSSSPFSSYFRDPKDRLKQQSPSPSAPPLRSSNFSFPASSNSQKTSLEEIRKNLYEFRRRTSVPPPDDPSSSSQQISFQEIYERNVMEKRGESAGNVADSPPAKHGGGGGHGSFDAIRLSLRKIGAGGGGGKGGDRMSLTGYKDAFRLKPSNSTVIGGGTSALPESVFGRELRKRKEGDEHSSAAKAEFVKMYGYTDLGEKLRKLRPEGKGKEWFSLAELNERLMRLREMEERQPASSITGVMIEALIKISDDDASKKASRQ